MLLKASFFPFVVDNLIHKRDVLLSITKLKSDRQQFASSVEAEDT